MKETIREAPWRHVLLENVFSEIEFERICAEVVPLCNDYSDGEHVLYLHDAVQNGKLSYEVSDIIVNMIDSVLVQNASKILSQFDNVAKSDKGYFCLPQFGITKNFSHGSHCDEVLKSYKTLTFLVYLSPRNSTGTIIYSDEQTYHSTVPWEPNSGVYFCPCVDNTWHAFKSDGETRITLNLSLKRIESLTDQQMTIEQLKHHFPNLVEWLPRYTDQGKLFNTSFDVKKLLSDDTD